MQAKKYLYAAVGAQVAVAKSAQAKLDEMIGKLNDNATSASTDLKGRLDEWAGEGEAFVGKVTDAKAIDDITSRVDFDQVQTQVNKLRDQLEDIVSTWRTNFRPESKPVEKVVIEEAPKAAAATAKAAASKTTASKSTASKTTASKTTASKTTASKKPAAKKPAAKTTSKTTAAKKPAAKSTTKSAATAS